MVRHTIPVKAQFMFQHDGEDGDDVASYSQR